MTTNVRSTIIFEALAQINPDIASRIRKDFNDSPTAANAVGMAELKRSLGFEKSFGAKVRFA